MFEKLKLRWDARYMNNILSKLEDPSAILEEKDIINLHLNIKDMLDKLKSIDEVTIDPLRSFCKGVIIAFRSINKIERNRYLKESKRIIFIERVFVLAKRVVNNPKEVETEYKSISRIKSELRSRLYKLDSSLTTLVKIKPEKVRRLAAA